MVRRVNNIYIYVHTLYTLVGTAAYFIVTITASITWHSCSNWTDLKVNHTYLHKQTHSRMFVLKKKASEEARWATLKNTAIMLGYFGTIRGLYVAFQYFGVHKMLE